MKYSKNLLRMHVTNVSSTSSPCWLLRTADICLLLDCGLGNDKNQYSHDEIEFQGLKATS